MDCENAKGEGWERQERELERDALHQVKLIMVVWWDAMRDVSSLSCSLSISIQLLFMGMKPESVTWIGGRTVGIQREEERNGTVRWSPLQFRNDDLTRWKIIHQQTFEADLSEENKWKVENEAFEISWREIRKKMELKVKDGRERGSPGVCLQYHTSSSSHSFFI